MRISDCGFARVGLLVVVVVLVDGCRTTPPPPPRATIAWQTDLALALDDARRTGRPVLVLAVIGDVDRQCWLAADAQRTVTFSDPETEDWIARRFVCAKVNLVPGLFLGSASHHSEELLAQFPEGGGGGNVRCLFCTQDGRIVSEVKGFWRPTRFREEADLALRMAGVSKETLQQMHVERAAALDSERAAIERERAALTQPEPKPSPWARKIAALNRMTRSHRESMPILLVPVEEHLRRVEDEVWTKGKVGWD